MRLVGLVALLALLALTLWAMRSSPTTPAVPSATVANDVAADARVHVARPTTNAAPELPRRLAPEVASAQDAFDVSLQVVDWATGEAIAGAELAWMDSAARERLDALPAVERARLVDDDELTAFTVGRQARSDAVGNVRIRLDDDTTDIVARHADHVGWTRIVAGYVHEVELLEVSREHSVIARVVDAGGTAGGVPLRFRIGRSESVVRTDDRTGTVRFVYTENWFGRDREHRPRSADADVRVDIPGLDATAVQFEPTAPPTEPLTITLPATGELDVVLTHPGREIESLGARLWIDAPERAWHGDADAAGIVRFRPVPLATEFSITVEVGDLEWVHRVAGPSNAGQRVQATIGVPPATVALTGRVVDAEGRPVVSTELRLRCNLPQKSAARSIRTDEHGRILWHPAMTAGDEPYLGRFVLLRADDPFDGHAVILAPRTLAPGVNDLGELRFAEVPLLVAGRFRFATADAVRSIGLRIERLVDAARPGVDERWEKVGSELFLDQDEGRFILRGTVEGARLRLVPQADAPPVEFRRGMTDLDVPTFGGR